MADQETAEVREPLAPFVPTYHPVTGIPEEFNDFLPKVRHTCLLYVPASCLKG
jgi:hypothetical protein